MLKPIYAAIACLLYGLSLNAQAPATRGAVVDPPELSGPPKKVVVVTPTKRAFGQSNALKNMGSKDPSATAAALREVTSLIQQDPTDTDFYFLRAVLSCEIPSSSKESMLNDVVTSIRLWKPSENNVYDSLQDHYSAKAKIEFLLGKYADAVNDLEASVQTDYNYASNVFNNGKAKPDEPPSVPCMWSRADVINLQQLFPKDYRTSLYVGLYSMFFAKLNYDADYQPILRAFAEADKLNPSSPLPSFFTAEPYIFGGIGGFMSKASATCLDDVTPRTKPCLDMDDFHRTGVRYLTKAIAADSTFEPAYAMRAEALYQLRESRQALRDYNKALELDPKARLHNDRALAEVDLEEYQAAILDYTTEIAQGCDGSLCPNYENRADVYLKLHDYPHAIDDIGHAIRNFLATTAFLLNIDQFRRIYPEYDDVEDAVLCEKLRALFMPQMSYADYSKQFLVNAKEVNDFILPDLFLKRGDVYADMGDTTSANREYDRVSNGYPKWAENQFTTINGKRFRVRQ